MFKQHPKMLMFLTVFITLLTYSNLTLAQGKSENVYSPLSSLYTCMDIEDSAARLECYDNSVANLRKAEQSKEVVAIDAKAARKIKREAFGFNLPSLPKLGLPKLGSDEKMDELVAEVQSVQKNGRVLVITLKNGQVWQQTGGQLGFIPKGDLTAKIRPKSLGSFKLSLSNGKNTARGLKVRRIK